MVQSVQYREGYWLAEGA